MWHDSCTPSTTHTLSLFMRDMTHSYVTWLIDLICNIHTLCLFIRDMTHSCGTWLIHMWHDSWTPSATHTHSLSYHVTWLIPMWHNSFLCDMTHAPHPQHTHFLSSRVTWFVHDMTHSCRYSGIFQIAPLFDIYNNTRPDFREHEDNSQHHFLEHITKTLPEYQFVFVCYIQRL